MTNAAEKTKNTYNKAAFKPLEYGRDFLTPEREYALWLRRDDADARDEILTAHLPLCRSLAFAAYKKFGGGRLSFDDLEGEAQMLMVQYYKKYNPDHQSKARFCTYIADRVSKELMHFSRRFSAAVSLQDSRDGRALMTHWWRFNNRSNQEDPTRTTHQRHMRIAALMAEHTSYKDIDTKTIAEFEGFIGSRGLSLSATMKDGGAGLSQDMVPCYADQPDVAFQRAHDYQRAMEVIAKLPERDRNILQHRILCDEDEKLSFKDLSAMHGVTMERIRQIESSTLKRIRKEMLSNSGPATPSGPRPTPPV